MTKQEFSRSNMLSERAMDDIATPNELEEFRQLLSTWSDSEEYNVLQGVYAPGSNAYLY